MDDFVCPLTKVPSITEWVQGSDEKACRPCLMSAIAQGYSGYLQEAGEQVHLAELQKAYDSGDILTIAKSMDRIKAAVGDDLRNKLTSLDCFAQTEGVDAAADK